MDINPYQPKKWYKKWWGVAIIFVATLFLIFTSASAFYVAEQARNMMINGLGDNLEGAMGEKYNAEGSGTNYWFGSSQPKVIIVEFADFSCPNCKKFNEKLRKMSIKYFKDIKIIFRDLPVISDMSIDQAMAGRCAGEQGLFWPMHDELFKNTALTQEDILANAKSVNLNMDKFAECMSSQKFKVQIQKDVADALNLNIEGTPTWFINGYMVQGDIPEEELEALITKTISGEIK